MNSAQYIQASRETFDPVYLPYDFVTKYNPGNTNTTIGISPDRQILYDMDRGVLSQAQGNAKLDSLSKISNLKQIGDNWYRPALLMNHTLSFTGGSEKYSFYNSLAYTNAQSYTPGEQNQAFKLNTRQDFMLHPKLKIYLIADLNYQTYAAANTPTVDNRFLPYQLFRDPNGNSISMPYLGYLSEAQRPSIEQLSKINLNYNPMDDIQTVSNKGNAFKGRFNTGITLKIIGGLSFEGLYGYIIGRNRGSQYADHNNYQQRINIVNFAVAQNNGMVTYHLPNSGGRYSVNNDKQDNWVVRNQLVYNFATIDGKHQLNTLFGQELQEQKTLSNWSTVYGYDQQLQSYSLLDYQTLRTTGILNPILPVLIGKSILSDPFFSEKESIPRNRFFSYYANMAYTFNQKYTLNLSWRNDQSNLFGLDRAGHRKPIWSAGLKWNLSAEPWLQGYQQDMGQLILRTTYGITGNAPVPGTASSMDVFTPRDDMSNPGLVLSTPANPKLTWENTTIFNLGLDFSLLKNRISGSLDMYYKDTEDLLGQLPVNPLTGSTFVYGNIGHLSNKGIELSLSTKNISQKNLNWSTTLNLAYNQNKIKEFGFRNRSLTSATEYLTYNYVNNYPANTLFAYNYAGLDQFGDPQVRLTDGRLTKQLADVKPNDLLNMGVTNPVWSGGLNNSVQYKHISLQVNLIYNLGHVMFRDVNQIYSGGIFISQLNLTKGNLHADFANRWKKPGDESNTFIPAFVTNPDISVNRRTTTFYTKANSNVVNASYIKARDIILTYQLPATWLKKVKLERLDLKLQLSNLMLWKANQYGLDPEFRDNKLSDYGIMPTNQSTLSFALNLTL